MRMFMFFRRTTKEILRDPANMAFGLGFPLVILLLLSAIQAGIPVSLFEIEKLTPGISVFGLSFMTLFSATLISKDRSSSFLQRLYTTPLTASDYILGYTLPLLPIAIMQSIICYVVAFFLGLSVTTNVFYAILSVIPTAVFFIALGLLCGTVFNDKQVGGICGALLTNLAAWLSGTWFDLDLIVCSCGYTAKGCFTRGFHQHFPPYPVGPWIRRSDGGRIHHHIHPKDENQLK